MKNTVIPFLLVFANGMLFAEKPLLAPTPPMGWNSWNMCGPRISEGKVKEIADAMAERGFRDAGYTYVVIDDNWQQGKIKGPKQPVDIPGRDEYDRLIADKERFPSGIKALSRYIQSKGLKFGIYTSPGCTTCVGCPGSDGYELIDINTFVEWEVDFLKLDWCGCFSEPTQVSLPKWRKLLDNCGRDIILSVNAGRGDNFTLHRGNAQMYRTTTDIRRVWEYKPGETLRQASVLNVIDRQEGLEIYHGIGHWTDPDMMQVGNPPLTLSENRAHFSMWAIFAAPLMIGTDVSKLKQPVVDILCNKEVIAIDQDPAGIRGIKIAEPEEDCEIYVKRLAQSGAQAVVFLNRTEKRKEIPVSWEELGITGPAQVRDLWKHEDIGMVEGSFTASVAPHDVVFLKIVSGGPLGSLPDLRIKADTLAKNPLIIEAEGKHANAEMGTIASDIPGYTGTGYHAGGTFTIFRVNIDREGTYTFKIRYCNSGSSDVPMQRVSNNPLVARAGAGWAEMVFSRKLKEGINWVKIAPVEGSLPEAGQIAIDSCEVSLGAVQQ